MGLAGFMTIHYLIPVDETDRNVFDRKTGKVKVPCYRIPSGWELVKDTAKIWVSLAVAGLAIIGVIGIWLLLVIFVAAGWGHYFGLA